MAKEPAKEPGEEPALKPPPRWAKEDWIGRIEAARKAHEDGRLLQEKSRKKRRKIIVRPVPKLAP